MPNVKLEKKLYLAKESPEPIFDLSDCALKYVPNGIFAVIKVYRKEMLYLQNNELITLKEGGNLCDLSLLKLLDLSSNKIEKLPSDIKYLKNLQVLRIDDNKLVSLPIEIGSLTNLEQLSLSANKLNILPNSLCELRKLQCLNIRCNSNLRSLPVTIYQNKHLQSLLLDDDQDWVNPPKAVVQNGITSILTYFAHQSGICDYGTESDDNLEESNTNLSVQHLNLYDQFIQDNLRRLEKQKEQKVLQKLISEKNILDQKEKELLLHQQNQNEKQKLLQNLFVQQQKLDEEISKCCRQKEKEQNKFIQQLQSVENTADEVIKQLIETNKAQKQKYVTSIVSFLAEDVPTKQNFRCQKVLESMEKLLMEEYSLTKKLKENDITRQNLVITSNLRETKLKNKISDLLSERTNTQNNFLKRIKEDTELQYAAMLMLIEKSDIRNIELQNQIAVIEIQLSNLTALELQNKNLYLDKHINDLAERRSLLSELLQDIFAEKESYRKELIEQLKQIEIQQSFKNKNEYWLMQYQRLLDSNRDIFSAATSSMNSSLVFKLTLFGVSHCTPFLSSFDLDSVDGLSRINDAALKTAGISSKEDRCSILKAIQHFIDEEHNFKIAPSAPPLEISNDILPNTLSLEISNNIFPSAPPLEIDNGISSSVPKVNILEPKSSNLLNEVLTNECVICMENQSNVVFLLCGHLCSCTDCSLLVKTCPLCRSNIEQKMQIYTA